MSPPGCRPGSPPLSPAVSERQRRRLIPGVACADNGAGRAPRPVWTVPRAVGDTTRAPRRRPATMTSPSTDDRDLAALPIGMFDSGMGGLTVLHECLVTLPGENFAYVGDTARFPYGEKTREELELLAGLLAVGKTRRVAHVGEVLAGQSDQALVEHGETAHARVEHADGQGGEVAIVCGGAGHSRGAPERRPGSIPHRARHCPDGPGRPAGAVVRAGNAGNQAAALPFRYSW